jgi:DNA-binding GntR family transcriptional regulator
MTIQALEATGSLGERGYERIRDAITSGVLTPGTRVTERALAQELGTSPTPVREALRRLEQEGLLERKGTRGLYVAQLPTSALSEMLYLQALLRGAAARLAAQKLTDDHLQELQDLLRQMEAAGEAGDAETIYELSRRFHQVIETASGNDLLITFLNTIDAFERSHHVQAIRDGLDNRPRLLHRSHSEHTEIARALTARDAGRAEALMRAHTLRAGESMGAVLTAHKQ